MKKTVIITGAAGNLGRATAHRFANDGYSVIATIEPGKDGPTGLPQEAALYPVDLLDETAVKEFVSTVAGKYGNIDAALLLAGGYAGGGISETDSAALQRMINLNFATAYNAARPIFLQMTRQAQGGRIVLVGARAALEPGAGKSALAYSLSKSMLFSLASMMNADGAANNVVTSVIVPSTIDTPENRAQMPNADFSKWVKPEKIAGVLAFIASEAAHPIVEPVYKVYGNRDAT